MSRFGTHYHVSRTTGLCAHTGETLPPGAPCVAALCEKPDDDGFERLDFSIAAWEAGARPPGLFSYWRASVPTSEGRRSPLVDDEVLLDLFERLAEDDRPQRLAFRFVLGLILMRKKQLKLAGRHAATDDKPERWLVHRRGSEPNDPPLEFINPQLTEADIRDLTDQLSEILESDL